MKRGLSQEGLKIIACVTMLIDHMGAVLFPANPWLRVIGRISFPIFCFLLSQGIHYTHSKKKYFLRLALWMIPSELAYDYALRGSFTWAHQSVMVTLLLGALMGLCIEKAPKLFYKLLLILPFAALAWLLRTDYSYRGIFTIALFLLTRDMPHKLPVQLIGLICVNCLPNPNTIQIFAVLSAIPIALYSGKKISRSRALQWGFYAFYPLHLAVLLLTKVLFA